MKPVRNKLPLIPSAPFYEARLSSWVDEYLAAKLWAPVYDNVPIARIEYTSNLLLEFKKDDKCG